VFRDLDLLKQAGVPLVFDPESGRYQLRNGYSLPPGEFSPVEIMSLVTLCHELGNQSGLPFHGPAGTAATKVESSLPARQRKQLRDVAEAIEIRLEPNNQLQQHGDTYRLLLESIVARRSIRIEYESASEGPLVTRLNPYRLLFSRRSWYVIGRSSLHRDVRTFNLGRVRTLEQLDDTYRIPRGFTIARYLRNAWHLVPERGPDRRVVVRFGPLVARNVSEVVWHKTQQFEFQPDGSLLFQVRVSGLNEISWWIQGYGDQAYVVEPPELRDLVRNRCVRLLERYIHEASPRVLSVESAPAAGKRRPKQPR